MRWLVRRMFAAAGTLAVLANCGAPLSHEELPSTFEGDLGALEQALDSSCGSGGPVQRVFNARAKAFTASAAMQAQGCQGDSYMFAIESYNSGVRPLQNPSIRPAPLPATKADCEATELRFYVWSQAGLQGSDSEHGTWQGPGGCELSLSAPATLLAGTRYTFAISARRTAAGLVPVRLEHSYR